MTMWQKQRSFRQLIAEFYCVTNVLLSIPVFWPGNGVEQAVGAAAVMPMTREAIGSRTSARGAQSSGATMAPSASGNVNDDSRRVISPPAAGAAQVGIDVTDG